RKPRNRDWQFSTFPGRSAGKGLALQGLRPAGAAAKVFHAGARHATCTSCSGRPNRPPQPRSTAIALANHAPRVQRAPRPRRADPAFVAEGAKALLRYLSGRLHVEGLAYARNPAPVPNGWVTYVFHFELKDNPALPPEFRGPLTLRLFATPNGMPHGRHEFAVQAHLRRVGYPVPAPLGWGETDESPGGAFLVFGKIRRA